MDSGCFDATATPPTSEKTPATQSTSQSQHTWLSISDPPPVSSMHRYPHKETGVHLTDLNRTRESIKIGRSVVYV